MSDSESEKGSCSVEQTSFSTLTWCARAGIVPSLKLVCLSLPSAEGKETAVLVLSQNHVEPPLSLPHPFSPNCATAKRA